MRELLCRATEPVKIPGGVTRSAEKLAAHVVVDPVDLMPLAIKMLDGFRPNKPAGTSDEDYFRGHGNESLSVKKRVAPGSPILTQLQGSWLENRKLLNNRLTLSVRSENEARLRSGGSSRRFA